MAPSPADAAVEEDAGVADAGLDAALDAEVDAGPGGPTFDESRCTLFVDANSGADSSDGRSRGTALESISAAVEVVGAGDTVCIYPGSYSSWTNRADGAADARIHFVSVERWEAKVTAPISNLGEYVDIDGFEVTGEGDGILNGNGTFASHSRIMNNHVYDLGPTGGCESCGNGIIAVGWTSSANYQGVDVEIFNNVVHGITQASRPAHVHGIYVSHPNIKVYNNVVYDVPGGWGIHGWHNANNIEVTGNKIVDTGYGIVLGNGDSPCDVIECLETGYVVTGNIMCNNGFGIDLRGSGHTDDNNAFLDTPPSGTNQRTATAAECEP